ncbi:MAG: hypothetical protein QW441_01835 [Nitrososphaerota archaeon]
MDTAIIMLRKSIYRFMEENDNLGYDELVKLRIEYAETRESALIYVTGKQLGREVAGITVIKMVDGRLVPQTEIIYDCEVVLKPVVPAFNVVLHELLHALGLGHSNFEKIGDTIEIMAESKRQPEPTIYVSTLDIYALYLLWFRDYDGRMVYLSDLPITYKEVKPYVVEFDELRKMYEELHAKYGELSQKVENLETRFERVETAVTDLIIKTGEISSRLGAVETGLNETSRRVEDVETRLQELNSSLLSMNQTLSAEIGELSASISSVNQTISTGIAKLGGEISALSTALEGLARSYEQVRLMLFALIGAIAACLIIFSAIILRMRRIYQKSG